MNWIILEPNTPEHHVISEEDLNPIDICDYWLFNWYFDYDDFTDDEINEIKSWLKDLPLGVARKLPRKPEYKVIRFQMGFPTKN